MAEDQGTLEEIKELLPDRAGNWKDLKSALAEVSAQIGKINEGHKHRLLGIAFKIGQNEPHEDYELAVLSLMIAANSGAIKECGWLLSSDEMMQSLLKCLQSNDNTVPKVDILNAVKRIITNDVNCDLIARSCVLDRLMELGEGSPTRQIDDVQRKSQEVLIALAMSEKTKDINKLQNKYGRHMRQQGLKELVMARRYGKAWKGKLMASLLRDRREQREREGQTKKREQAEEKRSNNDEEERRTRRQEEEEKRRRENEGGHKKDAANKDKDLEKPPHIMISYSAQDYAFAVALEKVLKKAGLPIWINKETDGSDLMELLAEAVENAFCLIIVVSSEYETDFNCKMEATYGHEMQKPIYPVLVENRYKPEGWLDTITNGMRFHEFFRPEDITPSKCRSLTLVLKNAQRWE